MKKLCISLLALITLLTINSFADGWYFDGANWKYEDKDGSYVTGEIKKSNGISYYLDDDGNMATDYLAEVNNNFYYFDSNGAMVTNTWVALDPSMIEDEPFDSDVFYMYFGNNGKAIKGDDGKKKDIDGKTYMFNNNGIMMVGWLTENGEYLDNEDSDDWYSSDAVYFAREDGSLAEGWLPLNDYHLEEEITNAAGDPLYLETIWFYFDPTSHKKNTSEKSINGKKYNFFEDSGRMMTEWEYLENEYGSSENSFIATNDSANRYNGYFNDGSLKKNEWIYAIPSAVIDSEAYDDYEYSWFYTKNNGGLQTDIRKKINNKYYLFDKKGIMKTGLVLLYQNKYFCNIDLEETDYEDFTKHYRFIADGKDYDADYVGTSGEDSWNDIDSDGYINQFMLFKNPLNEKEFSLRYYGEDGAEQTGKGIKVNFNDGEYLFYSNNKGALKEWDHDKYYINGFLAQAKEGEKYGIVIDWGQILNCDPPYEGSVRNEGYLTKWSYVKEGIVNYGRGMADYVMANDSSITTYERAYNTEGHNVYDDIVTRGRPIWQMYYPLGVISFDRFAFPNIGDGEGGRRGIDYIVRYEGKNSNFSNVIDRSGKVKKKGAYKDSEGNYWLVDNKNQFIGLFSVPVKWDGTATIFPIFDDTIKYTWDVPYYKSTVIDAKGNEKDKWIKFGEKDSLGNTELDYVVGLSDDNCVNFSIGNSYLTTE